MVAVAAAVPTAQVACQINVLLEPVAVELALAATKELKRTATQQALLAARAREEALTGKTK